MAIDALTETESRLREQEIVICPPSRLPHLSLLELFQFRHLLWSMVWREIRLQFNDIYLGFFWASARPLAMLCVFVYLKKFSQANMYNTIPYTLYFYSGVIFWFYFLEATNAAEQSVVKDAGLIKKIYFPRIITPLVPIVSNLYTLALAVVPLIAMMMWLNVYPGWQILCLPLVILQCMIFCLGIGTFFAALSLTSKDYERFLGIILYLGIFVSPVIYSPDMIPAKVRVLYLLNPMVGTLLSFRACFFDHFPFPVGLFTYSFFLSLLFLFIGVAMFKKCEIFFVDRL